LSLGAYSFTRSSEDSIFTPYVIDVINAETFIPDYRHQL
jgi:hypothetical protein